MQTRSIETLFAQVPVEVLGLCRTLRAAGKRGWVVGGCVRDLLRGQPANDWDIATDARPKEVMKLFHKVIPTGLEHGTVTVILQGVPYEVTTLRGEGAYADGRRPDKVHFLTDIEQDLARRDFTFNAIAFDPLERQLIDPFGGCEDLARRVLRAVGDPAERFAEDGLRILRAARFAATLQCQVDEPTLAAMASERSHNTFCKVSAERIHDEWMKALRAAKPSVAFSLMEQTGLLPFIDEDLARMVGCQRQAGHDLDVWQHGLAVMDDVGDDPIMRLAGLLHGIGEPFLRTPPQGQNTRAGHAQVAAERCDALLRKLKFSNIHRQRCVHLVQHHQLALPAAPSDAQVRRWVRRVSREAALDIISLASAHWRHKWGADPSQTHRLSNLAGQLRTLLDHGFALHTRDLAVNGGLLMSQLRLRPGRHVGQLLAALLEQVTDVPADNRKDILLARAQSLIERGEVVVR